MGLSDKEMEEKKEKEGKFLFGLCKVNEKGQIVIPKKAREKFGIKAGDSLILLGDLKTGLALMKADISEKIFNERKDI